jgi:tetratricopeptide (TPR) repeat protein
MNVVRRMMRGRCITVVSTLAAATIGLLFAVTTAEADDWQLCVANQPDQVPIACTAVINQGGRSDIEIARAYAIRGEWFRVRKRNDEALADFDHAEKLDPNSYMAIAGHGATLAQMGQLQEALTQYERAIALNPQLPAAYLMRGELRQRQNQLADAMADFDHAISLRGDVAIFYVRRGALLNINGDLDRAMADIDRAIALTQSSN